MQQNQNRIRRTSWKHLALAAVCTIGTAGSWALAPFVAPAAAKSLELLNVSYDPTRELWRQVNDAFVAQYTKEKGTALSIKQSHGGSGAQARAVVDGLDADVVTLALWTDTDAIRKAGLIQPGWEAKLPNRSLPYLSTIVFVVRKGNPRRIHDWEDLGRGDVQ